MNIYQIHEYSGEYEDFRDRIVGSYLRKEKAEKEKERLEKEEAEREARSRKCQECSIINSLNGDNKDVLTKECKEYCSLFDIYQYDGQYNDDQMFDCHNYECLWDSAAYKIEEVEVIE